MRVPRRSGSVDRRLLAVLLVAVSCAVAGCGGGAKSSSATASVGNSREAAEFEQAMVDGVKFAKCMRSHHVSFPDPGLQDGHMTINLSNVNTDAPAYTRVSKACATPPRGLSAGLRA